MSPQGGTAGALSGPGSRPYNSHGDRQALFTAFHGTL
jgi:hypothetical protein